MYIYINTCKTPKIINGFFNKKSFSGLSIGDKVFLLHYGLLVENYINDGATVVPYIISEIKQVRFDTIFRFKDSPIIARVEANKINESISSQKFLGATIVFCCCTLDLPKAAMALYNEVFAIVENRKANMQSELDTLAHQTKKLFYLKTNEHFENE